MKKTFTILILLAASLAAAAQTVDKTLRVDYIFSGDEKTCDIAVHGLSCSDNWYGRTVNMDKVPVKGNGQIRMKDLASGKIIYANSFSTLFSEWQMEKEAEETRCAFENTFLLPMPEGKAEITVECYDMKGGITGQLRHVVDPKEILIERKGVSKVDTRYIHKSGDPKECIDVVIVGEGYTAQERELFYKDASDAVEAILNHEPFGEMKDRFNFLAVAPESEHSGVSVPRKGEWYDSPLKSHFDTFHTDRYLTTTEIFKLHDLLAGLPYEHIIILANTDTYGGGGIYNSYTLTTARHSLFKPVVVHEFGHSFGALGDEYDANGYDNPFYCEGVEPWEMNITTRTDFDSKWQDMIDAGVKGVGLFEGAGYESKGIWRPAKDCRMRTNTAEGFCPVCIREIRKMIDFNCIEE